MCKMIRGYAARNSRKVGREPPEVARMVRRAGAVTRTGFAGTRRGEARSV